MVTDDTPMPFGKHKGTPMRDVPAEYLDWLRDQDFIHDDMREYLTGSGKAIDQDLADAGKIDRSDVGNVPDDRISRCKSCGAQIIWIKYIGKNHPVDAKARQGFLSIEDDHGDHIGWEPGRVHESHFATCPNADQHRGTAKDSTEPPKQEPDPKPKDTSPCPF